jgi:NADH:ubiquinone oxidoreductase subunit 5 (subunit L)/multisubunit Na+/H+ antiporter MnhA subunit
VVISTVYMLRAYRKTFMGSLSERWKDVVDLRPALRIPVTLVVIGLLCYGFFPQSFVQTVTPVLRNYLTIDRHLTDVEYGHGAVSPSSTEQHRPSALTQRGGSNIQQIARRGP